MYSATGSEEALAAGEYNRVQPHQGKWRELVSSRRLVYRCHGAFLWCYVCFVLLRFRRYAFIEAVVLRSNVVRYAGASIGTHTRVSFFFPFVYLEMSPFSEYFCTIIWRLVPVRRMFSAFGFCFSTLWPRAEFLASVYVRIQSINQSMVEWNECDGYYYNIRKHIAL